MTTVYTPNYEDYEDYVPPATRKSFEDWTTSAQVYALDNYSGWSSDDITRFASDIAWQMEGIIITDESLRLAVDDWFSGRNHYHKG